LDGLFGETLAKSEGKPAIAPPHWAAETGPIHDNGFYSSAVSLLCEATGRRLATPVWQIVQGIVSKDSKDKFDRMDRVLAGLAANDQAALQEWRSLIDFLKTNGFQDEYFYKSAAYSLSCWGHNAEALETWLTGLNIESKRKSVPRETAWDMDLLMAEEAMRCALRGKDLVTARRIIVSLNDRFSENRVRILHDTAHSAAGVRLLQFTLDQKQPDLTLLFLPTMETIIADAFQESARRKKDLVEKVKQRLSEPQ
jgi:hypothetical protein